MNSGSSIDDDVVIEVKAAKHRAKRQDKREFFSLRRAFLLRLLALVAVVSFSLWVLVQSLVFVCKALAYLGSGFASYSTRIKQPVRMLVLATGCLLAALLGFVKPSWGLAMLVWLVSRHTRITAQELFISRFWM